MPTQRTQKLHPGTRRESVRPSSSNAGRKRPLRGRLETQLAEQRIQVLHAAQVRAYLRHDVVLARLVPNVCAEARREFGAQAQLTLRVYRDPEIRKSQHLTLNVRLPSYDKRILERLDRVTQSLDSKLARAVGFILVTTDLCPPRGEHEV
jgi:hypothetical protein